MTAQNHDYPSYPQQNQARSSSPRATHSNTVGRGSNSSTVMPLPQSSSSHPITAASSSRDSPTTHPLTNVTVALAHISYQEDNKEKVARLQKAAKELGFELRDDECLESGRSDLEGWLEAQNQLYNTMAAKEEEREAATSLRRES